MPEEHASGLLSCFKELKRTGRKNRREIPFCRNDRLSCHEKLAWAEGRAGDERARAHPKARRERRGNVPQGIAARGAELAVDDVGADPMAARLAIRINALHGGAGHILHVGLLEASAASGRKPDYFGLICRS